MNVAVLGASNKADRYSYKAVVMLRDKGHAPLPVHPTLSAIEGIPVYPSIGAIPGPIDTATLYLAARNQTSLEEDLLASGVRRVIFNPGAENAPLAARLNQKGIETLEACTLVLLATGRF